MSESYEPQSPIHEEKVTTLREQVRVAVSEVVPTETLESLDELDLDDEDYLGAVYGELLALGEDPDVILQNVQILE